MGINTKAQKAKHIKENVDSKEKLERDLKSCMNCKFFYGHDSGCINNEECGMGYDRQKEKQQKNSQDKLCYDCPYGKGKSYCFPCIRKLLQK